MKKLMITTLSAAAIAFSLQADTVETFSGTTGTGFETLSAGVMLNVRTDDSGAQTAATYWYSDSESYVNGATSCEVKAYTNESPAYAGDKPAANALSQANANYLKVDASEGRIVRSINPNSALWEESGYSTTYTKADASSGGVYFDSLVQFTATEEAPETQSGDKLVVWLYGCDDETGTYGQDSFLAVTAGYIDNTVNGVVPHVYKISNITTVEPNSWHRLTIKALGNISSSEASASSLLGFTVLIDGVEAVCEDARNDGTWDFVEGFNTAYQSYLTANTLFPALKEGELTLVGVALEGTGAIDDITFTSIDPFPPAAATTFDATVTVEDGIGTGGIQVAYIVGEGEETTLAGTTISGISPDSATLTLKVSVVNDAEQGVKGKIEGWTDTETAVTITGDDDTEYAATWWTKTFNISAQEAGTTLEIDVSIEEDAGETPDPTEVPSINGAETADAAAFVAAFKNGATVTLPDGWTLANGVLTDANGDTWATVSAYYTVDATTGAISLSTALTPAFGASEDGSVEPIEFGDDGVTLNISNAKAGFYYGVKKLASPAATEGTVTWADAAATANGSVSVTVERAASETEGFYKAVVNDVKSE